MKELELKPCPRCGGIAKYNGAILTLRLFNNLGVTCTGCDLSTLGMKFYCHHEAADFWNYRNPYERQNPRVL